MVPAILHHERLAIQSTAAKSDAGAESIQKVRVLLLLILVLESAVAKFALIHFSGLLQSDFALSQVQRQLLHRASQLVHFVDEWLVSGFELAVLQVS